MFWENNVRLIRIKKIDMAGFGNVISMENILWTQSFATIKWKVRLKLVNFYYIIKIYKKKSMEDWCICYIWIS